MIRGMVKGLIVEKGEVIVFLLRTFVNNDSDEDVTNDTKVVLTVKGLKVDFDTMDQQERNGFYRDDDDRLLDHCASCSSETCSGKPA